MRLRLLGSVSLTVWFFLPTVVYTQPAPPARNARVRITTAAVVDLPGVGRLDGNHAVTSGSVLAVDDDSMSIRTGTGEIVHVARPRHRIVGAIGDVTVDIVTGVPDRGSAITVPKRASRATSWTTFCMTCVVRRAGSFLPRTPTDARRDGQRRHPRPPRRRIPPVLDR